MRVSAFRSFLAVLLALLLPAAVSAQEWTVSTNVVDYVNLGTLNIEASWAFHQHWSLNAGAKYNPFSFNNDRGQFQNKQRLFAVGGRWWPWHSLSGWWLAAKVQYQEYSFGGFRNARTEEGDRVGAGLSAGYTYMLHPHFNMEFGVGGWAGQQWYTRYSCPTCGVTEGSGKKGFVLPNDIIVSICYVF